MFRRFLAASGFANLADGIGVLAWVWVASTLTRDAALIALVPVALRLPWAVFAIPAGIVADRVDHSASRPVFNKITGLKDSWAK